MRGEGSAKLKTTARVPAVALVPPCGNIDARELPVAVDPVVASCNGSLAHQGPLPMKVLGQCCWY